MTTLRTSCLSTEAEFDALAAAWRALEQQVPHLLPFQTYDWNRQWWSIFSSQKTWQHDELLVYTIFDGATLVAVMPLVRTQVGLSGWPLYHYVRPFGFDPNLTELRLPLCIPAYASAIWRVWEELAAQGVLGLNEFQLINTKQLADTVLNNNAVLHVMSERSIPNYILTLDADWDSFKTKLKRNIKESLRHCYNSLKRDGLQPSLRVCQGYAEIMPELARFYALHGMRAAASHTTEHPDYFADPRHRAFLAALFGSALGSRCYLFCLELNGEVVAMRLAFHMGEELYLYYSGYDLSYGKYSVMTTLVAETIQWSIAQKIPRINLSVGEDVSKTRWGPSMVEYAEYQCVSNTSWHRMLGSAVARLRNRRKQYVSHKAVRA